MYLVATYSDSNFWRTPQPASLERIKSCIADTSIRFVCLLSLWISADLYKSAAYRTLS
jgi:hypothetical protein